MNIIAGLPRNEYHRSWRKQNKDKVRESFKKYRQKNKDKFVKYQKEYEKRFPQKKKAHNFVKNNNLIGNKCEKCNSIRKLEAHHPDYSKPSLIITLCRICHNAIHIQ